MHPQTFIFIGRSGCGKGTQAQLLMEYIKHHDTAKRPICYLESGARFRDFIQGSSYSSTLSKKIYERAERQPDFLAISMWSQLLIENLTGEEHLVMDGAPRSLPEAMALDTAFDFYNRKVNVVFLNVSREWSRKRLIERGRSDDVTLEKIEKRLEWFDADSMPAVEYFRKNLRYNLIELNGEQGKDQVHEELVRRIVMF